MRNSLLGAHDTDGDGLYDWEEELWETDKLKKDTDGDGTNDNDEVLANRDPTRAGPDDSFASTGGSNSLAQFENTTEEFAYEFFSSYLLLKQTGELTEQNKQRLVQTLVASTKNSFHTQNHAPEVFTTVATGGAARSAYLTQLESNIMTPLHGVRDDLEVLYVAKFQEQPELYEELNQNTALYQELIAELLVIPVPEDALSIHAAFTNSLEKYAAIISLMQNPSADPLTAFTALEQYTIARSEFDSALKQLDDYFASHEHAFSYTPLDL